MFDVWLGEMELTTLTLLLSVFILLPLQLLLCFRVRSRILRLLPVILCSLLVGTFLLLAHCNPGWDSLGYLFLALFAGFLLAACGVGWGIWAITRKRKKQ